jgi:hypothetical protein
MMSVKLAYLLNILILLPIAVPTVFRIFPTDQNCFIESEGWRKLIGSVWVGILILSIFGLIYPLLFCPILMLQIIYKSSWLLTYALPRVLKQQYSDLPLGITLSFMVIVIVYPIIIPWHDFFRLVLLASN